MRRGAKKNWREGGRTLEEDGEEEGGTERCKGRKIKEVGRKER
jgi:hypothetical protein